MNIKFNLGILKDKYIKFNWIDGDRQFEYGGMVLNIKNKKNSYIFTFENGYKLSVLDEALAKSKIRKNDDGMILISYNPCCPIISGFVGFSMFDTYGFPIEMTKEILNEDGFELDTEGYYILKQIQKEFSSGTYKNKDGWNK